MVIFCHLFVHLGPFVDQDDDGQVAPHHHQKGQKPGHCKDKDKVKQLLEDFYYSLYGTFYMELTGAFESNDPMVVHWRYSGLSGWLFSWKMKHCKY